MSAHERSERHAAQPLSDVTQPPTEFEQLSPLVLNEQLRTLSQASPQVGSPPQPTTTSERTNSNDRNAMEGVRMSRERPS